MDLINTVDWYVDKITYTSHICICILYYNIEYTQQMLFCCLSIKFHYNINFNIETCIYTYYNSSTAIDGIKIQKNQISNIQQKIHFVLIGSVIISKLLIAFNTCIWKWYNKNIQFVSRLVSSFQKIKPMRTF